jgi:co-chaperonin GroES (HSP10)
MHIRPLRGQVVIREETPPASKTLWTPAPGPRQVHTHTGKVLAMGPPARTARGAEVVHGFAVGDVVQFHFTHLEELARNTWEDGKPALWIPQENVDAVWEES